MPTKNDLAISRDTAREMVKELANVKSWVDRKVETLNFNSDGTSRKSLSFDFSPPAVFVGFGYVPITTLVKKPLRALDVRDAGGGSVSTLKLEDNADIAVNLLASGISSKNLTKNNIDLLTEIIKFGYPEDLDGGNRPDPYHLLTYYNNLISANNRDDYLSLAVKFISGFLFWIRIDKESSRPQRLIVKISYEEKVQYIHPLFDFPSKRDLQYASTWKERLMLFIGNWKFQPTAIRSWINANESMSTHFEVRAPLGLLITENKMKLAENEATSWTNSHDGECPTQISHVSIRNSESRYAFVDYKIVAERKGMAFLVFWASVLVSMVYLLPLFFNSFNSLVLINPGGGSTVPLLVLGPALLFTYLARPVEHGLVSSRMAFGRFSLMFSSILLALAALILSGIVRDHDNRRLLWDICACISVVSLSLAIFWNSYWTVSSKP